jgi:hypothetical protein
LNLWKGGRKKLKKDVKFAVHKTLLQVARAYDFTQLVVSILPTEHMNQKRRHS